MTSTLTNFSLGLNFDSNFISILTSNFDIDLNFTFDFDINYDVSFDLDINFELSFDTGFDFH